MSLFSATAGKRVRGRDRLPRRVGGRERGSRPPVVENRHGKRPEDQTQSLPGYSLQQAGAEPVQRPSWKAGISIEQLAESIATRTLLQSLNVRAVVDAEGNETGMFEVPAGGRRYRALELLCEAEAHGKDATCALRRPGPEYCRG